MPGIAQITNTINGVASQFNSTTQAPVSTVTVEVTDTQQRARKVVRIIVVLVVISVAAVFIIKSINRQKQNR